jgi:hypothetical protein
VRRRAREKDIITTHYKRADAAIKAIFCKLIYYYSMENLLCAEKKLFFGLIMSVIAPQKEKKVNFLQKSRIEQSV